MYVLEINSLFFNFVFSNQVGGQEKIRRLWQHYYQGSDGLIFVVDSSDRERIDEAREELHGILSWADMSHVPIVIIANKQDLPSKFNFSSLFLFSKIFFLIDAMKPSDLIQKLGMNELGAKHKWFVQSACAVTGDGLIEAMLEMGNLVKQHRKGNDY
jgi:hypothetical protein